tara:strand:- start:333 stop:1094 length:762 start_codon:yes stop_codon:yes gene_type:complete
MSRKNLRKKSSILRLKLLFEDKTIVEEENKIGNEELSSILKDFSKKVNTEQKEEFEKKFLGIDPNEEKRTETSQNGNSSDIICANKKDDRHDIDISESKEYPAWIKKLYRSIVLRSHPDKYIDFPILDIKNKYTKIYIDAVTAIKTNDIGLLLLCAYEVELEVNENEAMTYISESMEKYKTIIANTKNLIGYQWYHIPNENIRLYFLENYLNQLGYVFDRAKAEEHSKNRRILNRKPGTRPEKTGKSKRNKKM